MVLGISQKRASKKIETPVASDFEIERKITALSNAVKIPAPIFQFRTVLEETDENKLVKFMEKYVPETRKQRMERLKKENPKEGPKPILIKFGASHVVDLIKQKKAKLVVIAADVAPITLVVALPTLCKKMGIPYAIVKSKSTLGRLVHMKSSAVVCIEGCRAEDNAEFNDLIKICNGMFADQYEKHMTTVGGGKFNKKKVAAN